MTAIWEQRKGKWRLLGASSFPDEASLHDRVEEAPQLLPLAGSPRITVLGREVRLGSGYADLVAVERNGRPAVIEVKLARNAEARRAVVAQVLAYASYLYGLSISEFERDVLGDHLRRRGFDSVGAAAAADDQAGGLNQEAFSEALSANLASGRFRLVLVLDEAPEELVTLVGYLEAVTPELVIDLVTVAQYEVGGSQVLVPQRVEPGRREPEATAETTARAEDTGYMTQGADDFYTAIESASAEAQPQLRRMADWAVRLFDDGLLKNLGTYHGKTGNITLLPRLPVDDAGLVTIWHDDTGGYVQWWRTVFERRAPESVERLDDQLGADAIGQGKIDRDVTDELLEMLTDAYREAVANITG